MLYNNPEASRQDLTAAEIARLVEATTRSSR